MVIISDLPSDVMEEILLRVPASSLRRSRLACKRWNALVKDPSFTKKHFHKAPRQSLVVTNMSHGIYSMSFNLHGIHNNVDPFIESTLKHSLIDPQSNSEANIPEVFHCDGLFLCTIADSRLVVWNPWTSQTVWFKPREPYHRKNIYALGYSNSNKYSYKILREFSCDSRVKVEIYEFCSNSWRFLDDDVFPNCFIRSFSGVSLKGDAYWLASPKTEQVEDFILLSFDFSTERFRCRSFPFRNHGWGDMSLAVVREEQLSVLHWRVHRLEVEIWLMSTKTDETTDVSWSNLLKVGLHSIPHLKQSYASSFFIDHDQKVVVCFYKYQSFTRNFVYVIGEEEETFKEIFLGEYPDLLRWPVTFNYVPSKVRLPEDERPKLQAPGDRICRRIRRPEVVAVDRFLALPCSKKLCFKYRVETYTTEDGEQREALFQVGHYGTYTPKTQDRGCGLKVECSVICPKTGDILGVSSSVTTTSPVLPELIPRSMVSLSLEPGSFTVLSYNILSDATATSSLYANCPPSARTWTFRIHNLLREIVGYDADIVCLQEVTQGMFDFLQPKLEKHGYVVYYNMSCSASQVQQGILERQSEINGCGVCYKRRTNELLSREESMIDGCAIFCKRDKFLMRGTYCIEFNKPMQDYGFEATKRLVKDNVALIVLLEPCFGDKQPASPRQLICVGNTCLDVEAELKDVLLCHIHTLLKGMEEIAETLEDLPMILCGSFNMDPGSASHSLVVKRKINPLHQDLEIDPLGILQPHTKFSHRLSMASAYSAFSRLPLGVGLDSHKARIDSTLKEPLFTICTKDRSACHDYIFYTEPSLRVESLMELLDRKEVNEEACLPSKQWPSSHIALLTDYMTQNI